MQRRMSISCIVAWHTAAGPDLGHDQLVPSWPCSGGQQHSRPMHGSGLMQKSLMKQATVESRTGAAAFVECNG